MALQRDKPLVWLNGEVKTPPFSESARLEALNAQTRGSTEAEDRLEVRMATGLHLPGQQPRDFSGLHGIDRRL